MIRRLIVTSVLAVLSAAAIAPKANAQSIDVPFTGTVGGACTFSGLTPGKLATEAPGDLNGLYSYTNGGTDGKVSISCNRASSLKVSKPVQTQGPQFTPTTYLAEARAPSGKYTYISQNGSGAPLTIATSTNPIPLRIRMKFYSRSSLTPGTYGFKTTLTVTPR